jgi:hypothetical protein
MSESAEIGRFSQKRLLLPSAWGDGDLTMTNIVGIVEGEIKNGTRGKKRVLGSVTRMTEMPVTS